LNLAFVVERPTQFEVPFYRHVAGDPEHRLRVIYTAPDPAAPAFDPELERTVAWGFELLEGYDHAVCPTAGRARWLAAEMRHARYDLVITNGYTQRRYLLATAAARRAGSATALRLDSALFDVRPPRVAAKRALFGLVLARLYDLFLGVGTLTLEYLRACGVRAERTALFPYAVDVEGFRGDSTLAPAERAAARRRLGVPPEASVVLCVAKLHPREAPWDLLRAVAQRPTGAWLLVAGDGPARPELERYVADRRLERVVFLGYVPYPELPVLYGAADVFAHPAREERWGVSVAEALACGLPVVTSSRVGAARDLITAGRNGFTYAAGDAASLARRLEEAASLPAAAVRAYNATVLAAWNYAATWRGLLAAAERTVELQRGS
jgi:glycosyltransferase involved in cell wall biosynthesis